MTRNFLTRKVLTRHDTQHLEHDTQLGTKIRNQDSGTRPQYQDLGTKILVPKKRRAREAEPLGMQGGTGGCRPPARGSGGLEAPQEQQRVWGAAAPQ